MTVDELEKRARRWLDDSKVLHEAGRFESAVYLCGYAVEFALKSRICALHEWTSYRDDLPGMRTHNLVNLFDFTALESRKRVIQFAWDYISTWSPEIRYDSEASFTKERSQRMIVSAEILLKEVL